MSRRILIVDDDRRMVERRAKLLKDRGYEVICAFNGKEGLRILRKDKNFDLLILDLDMPKLRGDELLERIKDDPKVASLSVLVITGMDEPIKRKDDTWEYEYHPVTRAKMLGLTHRGWDKKFKLVRKWYSMDMFVYNLRAIARAKGLKIPQPSDELSDRKFLEAVEEMFLEPEVIDRPREEGEPWRILIVEDDKDVRENIRNRLIKKNKHYEIIEAEDGQKALEVLSKDPVDLVILDLEMPRTRGDEVLNVLSSNFILNYIPVIVYTGVMDWDKPDDESLRKKVEKMGVASVTYEKKKEGLASRIFRLDTTSMLVDKVDEFLKKRQEWGYGYLKEPITFFKNKKGYWMPGCMEYYQPIDPRSYRYEGFERFWCSYCLQERPKDESFIEVYEYCPEELFPFERFEVIVPSRPLICASCVKELKKNPNFGKYALINRKEREKEKLQKEEIKKRIKKPPKVPMNEEVFNKVKEIIREVCFTARYDEIEPTSNLKEDIFKNPYLFSTFMFQIKNRLELEFDLSIPSGDLDWFDTVEDIVDYIDERKSAS